MVLRKLLVLTLSLAALSGCTVWLPVPDSMMAGGDEGRLSNLRLGRDLYIAKCSGCHSLLPVDKYDDARWTAEIDEMLKLKKVRLTDDDRAQILAYLTTANKVPR